MSPFTLASLRALLAGGALLLATPAALAEDPHAAPHGQADPHAAHGADAHASGDHGDHGMAPFNWAYGFVGEEEGVEPSLLYRPKGMPRPFLANVINAALLFGIIYTVGKKPIAEALKKRKERIVAGMEEAGKMKADAAKTLAQYEEKLKHLDQEIERIKKEMREAAEAERKRILSETKERRERMERDAKLLVEQELKAAREALMRETVAGAVRSAEDILAKQLGAMDHDRLAREYLEGMQKVSLNATGGRS
jgi:F-type H+-transporting ATPase subunit b